MTRSSIIPTRRSRWPAVVSILTLLLLMASTLLVTAIKRDSASVEQQKAAVGFGYDQGFADAINSVSDTVAAAYSTGYQAALREASGACHSPRQGAPL